MIKRKSECGGGGREREREYDLTNKKLPKILLSLFCVGYLLLGLEPAFRSDLYPQ